MVLNVSRQGDLITHGDVALDLGSGCRKAIRRQSVGSVLSDRNAIRLVRRGVRAVRDRETIRRNRGGLRAIRRLDTESISGHRGVTGLQRLSRDCITGDLGRVLTRSNLDRGIGLNRIERDVLCGVDRDRLGISTVRERNVG